MNGRPQVDGADRTIVDCADPVVSCDEGVVWLGLEQDGSFDIEVRRGSASARTTVNVGSDRCHVRTEHVVVTLPAS